MLRFTLRGKGDSRDDVDDATARDEVVEVSPVVQGPSGYSSAESGHDQHHCLIRLAMWTATDWRNHWIDPIQDMFEGDSVGYPKNW